MKRKSIGLTEEPFDCPYCGEEITCEDTATSQANWEEVRFDAYGELDKMNCPHCHKRFELYQRL